MTTAPSHLLTESYQDAVRRLEALKRSVDLYDVTRKSMMEERDGLLKEKGRHEQTLDRVPVAQSLLQSLYDKSSGALIKSCESAMTDAVQGVIGDGSRIGIDAEISNNQIKVSVGTVVDLKDDVRVLRDIISNEGGGLTNVVSTSLRAISLVRSGQRRFIVLDESNCYLNPSQIPPYMSVVRDLAFRAGFQVIMLTHHGIEQFENDDDINIITLRPSEDGAVLHSTHQADTTTPNIISSIELTNFGAHANLRVPLIAGLNVVTGPSNVGKSRIRSALRAVITGDGTAGDIRTAPDADGHMIMEKSATVRITFDGGKVLEWTRKKTGSPVESWNLQIPGHKGHVSLDGIVCSGRNGMQWVGRPDVMNMTAIGGMWPALHAQLLPVFALDNPKALSALIAVSKTSIHLQAMIQAVSERKREAMADIRRIDIRLNRLSELLFKLESELPPIQRLVEDSGHQEDAINVGTMNLNAANDLLAEMDSTSRTLAVSNAAKGISVPEITVPDIDGMLDVIEDHSLAEIDVWAGNSARGMSIENLSNVDVPDISNAINMIREESAARMLVSRADRVRGVVIQTPDIPPVPDMIELLINYDSMAFDQWAGQNAKEIQSTFASSDDQEIQKAIANTRTIHDIIHTTKRSMDEARICSSIRNISGSIILPDTKDHDVIESANKVTSEYQSARNDCNRSRIDLEKASQEKSIVLDEINALKEQIGVCPTCGHLGASGIHEHQD